MEIETVEDLANWFADKLSVYGTCKNAANSEDCNEETPFCCRVGFMTEMTRRIEQAVENDKKIATFKSVDVLPDEKIEKEARWRFTNGHGVTDEDRVSDFEDGAKWAKRVSAGNGA